LCICWLFWCSKLCLLALLVKFIELEPKTIETLCQGVRHSEAVWNYTRIKVIHINSSITTELLICMYYISLEKESLTVVRKICARLERNFRDGRNLTPRLVLMQLVVWVIDAVHITSLLPRWIGTMKRTYQVILLNASYLHYLFQIALSHVSWLMRSQRWTQVIGHGTFGLAVYAT
jgi:hypothetical protein